MKIKEQVEQILKENIECRNSDNKLILEYIKRYHSNCYFSGGYSSGKGIIEYDGIDWSNLTSERICLESITRARRALRDKYPSSKEVENMRRKQEKEMYNEYSSNIAYNKVII